MTAHCALFTMFVLGVLTLNVKSKTENYTVKGLYTTMNDSLGLKNEKTLLDTHLRKRSNDSNLSSNLADRSKCLDSGKVCNSYVLSWSYFYLKIGGWLMLGIVLVGISCLILTHYLGVKKARRDRRRNARLTWSDAKAKSTLAKWM